MNEFTIITGTSTLSFRCTQRDAQGDPEIVEVTLRGEGLQATVFVNEGYLNFEDFAEFFTELGYGWKGWSGEVVYESIEHDLKLTARHDGRVCITVELMPSAPLTWRARGDLVIEPGSDLVAVVAGVTAVLGERLNA